MKHVAKLGDRWKTVAHLNVRWVLICSLIFAALTAAIWKSPIGSAIDTRFVQHLEFWMRDQSGNSPKVSDRLKIYAFDDRTLGKTKTWVLSFEQWTQLLQTLAQNEPSAIVIDQLFSTVPGADAVLAKAVETISALPLTVVTGAFLTPSASKIPYRDGLEVEQFPKFWLSSGGDRGENSGVQESEMPVVNAKGFNVYGPQANLRTALNRIGHLMYSGMNSVGAFYELDAQHAVPHASFLVSSGLKVRKGVLYAGDARVPIRPDGTIPVNFISTEAFYSQSKVKTMHQLLDIVESGEKSKLVEKGDVVLILPHMYTGHTDFAMTPFGQMPAGLILGSMINSVLSGAWIETDQFGIFWVAIAALTGGFCAFFLNGAVFFSASIFTNLLVAAVGLIAFVKLGLMVDWLPAMVSFTASAGTVFTQKMRVNDRVTRILKSSFEGVIPEARMDEIIRSQSSVDFSAREINATIMFVDIVAFSKTTEEFESKRVFEDLREVHKYLADSIYQCGGMIDRSLGDGVLVYFGVDLTDANAPARAEDHALNAMQCAALIQSKSQKLCMDRESRKLPVYPLRIGINTGKAFFGDVGASNRIDFTAIGMSVNFAKRLESACVPHGVCISESTYGLVGNDSNFSPKSFDRIEILLKHASKSIHAFSYRNPV